VAAESVQGIGHGVFTANGDPRLFTPPGSARIGRSISGAFGIGRLQHGRRHEAERGRFAETSATVYSPGTWRAGDASAAQPSKPACPRRRFVDPVRKVSSAVPASEGSRVGQRPRTAVRPTSTSGVKTVAVTRFEKVGTKRSTFALTWRLTPTPGDHGQRQKQPSSCPQSRRSTDQKARKSADGTVFLTDKG